MVERRAEPHQERALRILRCLMEGRTLDAKEAAAEFGVNREAALPILKALHHHIPSVVQETQGTRFVFRFDPERLSGGSILEEHQNFAVGIAVTLGAAFSRLFGGTRYQMDLINLRRAVVERLSANWRAHFDHLGRKFFVVAAGEENLDDRAALLDEIIDAVLKQKSARLRYTRFESTKRRGRCAHIRLLCTTEISTSWLLKSWRTSFLARIFFDLRAFATSM